MTEVEILDIRRLIDDHRDKAFITCDEYCFCWVIERWMDFQEKYRTDG